MSTGAANTSRHAVVIGGSMAGLWAGRVLTDHFDRVTIIERDHFPDGPVFRSGVPQGHQLHIFLARGLEILNDLFPDLTNELDAAGAVCFDAMEDAAFLLRTGWTPRFRSGILTYAASRNLLEWTIRRRLEAHPKIRFLESTDAVDLLADETRFRVTGVRLRFRRGANDEAEAGNSLDADLVVDASGRGSSAPEWLEKLDYQKPAETVVNSFLGYSSRWYRRPPDFRAQWKLLFVASRPPDFARGGAILQVEGDQWAVGLVGAARDYPPTDEAGFMEFARSLMTPAFYEAIQDAEPLTPIYGYRRTANQLRHYERLSRWPENFIVIGDAACAFNPVYGQGMSVAAMGALTLDQCLREGRGDGMAPRFQKQLAKTNAIPWLLATGEDFRYPTTEGGNRSLATRLSHWYIDQVLLALPGHQDVARAFTEVAELVKPPAILFQPVIAAKALGAAMRQRGNHQNAREELPAIWNHK